uniref:Transposase Tc1-like domain-containing protein n=1 Tax=Cyprinus carpio carpio TaxID=630221 RepID=A0A9J7X4E1_CYPCA
MEITTWAQEYFQKTLSVNTIHRAIRRCRLKFYSSKKKPYLNMIQKRRRFLWAKAHLKWTVAKWKTVLWSDESKFEVLFGKLGRHVIRTKEDKDNPSCYQRSVQKTASLMVWGCMSACGMGSLHIWKGTINAERYIQVLEQHMLPSRRRLFQGRPCIFQHDNIFLFMMRQMFSMGERSGLQAGHFSTRILLRCSHDVVIDAVCGLVLSCWKMQGLP